MRVLWTEESTEYLKKAVADHKSVDEIAAALGGTRNAVIGKAHRLGLSLHGCAARTSAPEVAAPRKRRWKPPAIPRPAEASIEDTDPIEAAELVRSPSALLSLSDLSAEMMGGTCRWPIGDPRLPDFGFCGVQATPDAVYCPHHCALACGGHPTVRRPYGA